MTATLYCGNNRSLMSSPSEPYFLVRLCWIERLDLVLQTRSQPPSGLHRPCSIRKPTTLYLYKGPWTNVNYGEDIQIGYLFFTIIDPLGTMMTTYARPLSTSPIPGIPTLNDQTTQCALN